MSVPATFAETTSDPPSDRIPLLAGLLLATAASGLLASVMRLPADWPGVRAAVLLLFGQTLAPSSPRLAFEVASIKPNTSAGNAIGNKFDSDRFTYTNVPVKTLLLQVFRMKDYQVLGGPDWISRDRWDVVAKSEKPTTMNEKFQMLQALFEDQLQLKFHRETRQLPVYSMVVAKNGPKLQDAIDDDKPAGLRIQTGMFSGHKWEISGLSYADHSDE